LECLLLRYTIWYDMIWSLDHKGKWYPSHHHDWTSDCWATTQNFKIKTYLFVMKLDFVIMILIRT
jgi:hypothetical protein